MLIILLIQIPAVQTKITQKVASSFAKQWGTEVSIGKVNLRFFETATLERVYIEDQAGDTLLWAGYMKADIGAFALFDQRLELNEVALEDAYINLYRLKDSTQFNYEFIVNSFTADSVPADTTTSNFIFDLHQARLQDVRLRFVDDSTNMALHVRAPYLLAELNTLGLEEQFIKVSNVDIRNLEGSFVQLAPEILVDTLATAPEVAQELDSAMLNPSGFRIAVDEFLVQDSRFHYQANEAVQRGSINFENLDLRNININIQEFYLAGDTLRGSVDKLAAIDQNSGFVLKNFAMDLALELPMFSATLHEVITPNTLLEDDIRIEQLSLKPGADMLASLQASANIENARIGMKDLAYFTPGLDTLPFLLSRTFLLDLEAKVADNEAKIAPLQLRTEDGGMYLEMAATATGLNNLDRMRFDVQLRELSTTTSYLEQFAFTPELPPAAAEAGRIHLIAQAEGTLQNIDFAARMRSGLGLLETNMLYRSPTSSRFLLAGNIEAKEFDLTPFVGDSLGLNSVTLSSKVRINGYGDQINVDEFSLLVQELEYNGYTYEGLAAEGYFVDSTLEVAAAYEDPYLNFDLLLKSDLKDSLPLVKAELNLDKMNMYRLNLSPDSIIVSTKLLASVRGSAPDNIRGIVELRDTELIRGAKSWTMDSLVVASSEEPNGMREIVLTTDFMSAKLTGKYLFEDLPLAIDQCASYYCSAYKPTGDMVDYGQEIKLAVKMWDEPVIAKAFVPQLELLYPMTIQAELRDEERAFDLQVRAPGISWDSLVIKQLDIDATTVDRVMSFEVAADKIVVGQLADIPQFALEGQWAQDSVHFNMGLAPRTDSTHLFLGGSFTFANDTIALALDETDLAVKGEQYLLADNTVIKYSPDYLYIQDFILQQEEQRIALSTAQESTANPLLNVLINSFQVSDFMDILGMQEYGLAATLDGEIQLIQPLNLSAMEAELMVNNLVIDSLAVGDLQVQMNKVSDNGRINTLIALEGPQNDLKIEGFINIEDSTNAIALDVDIRSFNLTPWEPFVEEFITDLDGNISGDIDIAGSLNQPQIEGILNFGNSSTFRLALTGAKYTLQDETIVIDNEAIRLKQFTLEDSLRQTLIVDGQIWHQNFEDFRLDLSMKSTDFQLVNKPRDLDALFYGELFVRTDARISGPLDEVVVTGDLRVNDRTDFALVIQLEDASASTADYINFVNTNAYLASDTAAYAALQRADSVESLVDVGYFTLDATVQVPETATFTVVVDPNTGDYLQVQGTAELQVYMSPAGDLNLQGIYEVESGMYRLSFMEVMQKSFYFQEGSTIAFTGDPLNAELDLRAIYNTEASLLPLISAAIPGDPEYDAARRKTPVNVILIMEGTLESPVLSFNITLPDVTSGPTSLVAQALDQIKSNETELFRQIFGLIVLNRFIAENPLEGGGGGGAQQAVNSRINQSVGGFLSDQLNALTQDYLGVEIEIDIASSQAQEAQLGGGRDVGFSLSRSLFNDRIEVQVGGVTSTGGGAAGGSAGTGFAGNFAILYHINERGNLNLKIFQRNDRDYITNEFIPKTGVALSYYKNFNTLEGLFGTEPTRREMLKSDGAVKTEL